MVSTETILMFLLIFTIHLVFQCFLCGVHVKYSTVWIGRGLEISRDLILHMNATAVIELV